MPKFILIALFILIFSVPHQAQTTSPDQPRYRVKKVLKEILSDSDFKNAGFAFYAFDWQKRKVISAINPDKSMIPASNQKLITTATMLELYGPDFRFSTRLEYTGHIDTVSGILHGNIVIRGGGDPTLGSEYFDTTKNGQFLDLWVDAIQKSGIDSIAGAIIADPGIYDDNMVPLTWSWNNMGRDYGAGACGLTIYDNSLTILFNTIGNVGDSVIITGTLPEIPRLKFDNAAIIDSISYNNLGVFGTPYSPVRYLQGSLPINKTRIEIKTTMPNPAYIAACELSRRLRENGIAAGNSAKTVKMLREKGKNIESSGKLITELLSLPYSEIMRETNTNSNNLYAEHFMKHIGLKICNNSSTEKAANEVVSFWKSKGINTKGMTLFDGSGLSRFDCFTPRQIVQILTYMKDSSQYFDYYYNSLPIGGKTGTLKNMFKDFALAQQIRAKSGTVSRVKAYAGYIKTVSGKDIVFSMVANNFTCSTSETNKKLEKLMVALALYK